MNFAITGATGKLGRLVIEQLKTKLPADNIIAVARNPEKGSDLGVRIRKADYGDEVQLEAALKDVDTLLFISSSEVGQRGKQHRNVIAAAKKAGVKWIVYTSMLHTDVSLLALGEEHRATEAVLKASGIPFTLLRNGWYFENYAQLIRGALAKGALIGCAGDGKISSAARADYAAAAVAVLTGSGHVGKTYELAGDIAHTMSDLAAELSQQTGRTIPYKNLTEADFAAALVSFGLPEGFAKAVASSDTGASKGGRFDNGKQLSKLIGRPTKPLNRSVAAVLGNAE
jgi:NAD(P)H dehydrogenase (quinone)